MGATVREIITFKATIGQDRKWDTKYGTYWIWYLREKKITPSELVIGELTLDIQTLIGELGVWYTQ